MLACAGGLGWSVLGLSYRAMDQPGGERGTRVDKAIHKPTTSLIMVNDCIMGALPLQLPLSGMARLSTQVVKDSLELGVLAGNVLDVTAHHGRLEKTPSSSYCLDWGEVIACLSLTTLPPPHFWVPNPFFSPQEHRAPSSDPMAANRNMLDKKGLPHRRRSRPPHLSPMQANLVAAVGEFVGTFLFLYFSYAGNVMAASQASTTGPNGGMSSETVVFTSLAYSLSLLVNVWAFYRISGGLFNPAVSQQFALPLCHVNVDSCRCKGDFGVVSGFTAPMDTRHYLHPSPASCFSMRWRSRVGHVPRQYCRGEYSSRRRDVNLSRAVYGNVLHMPLNLCSPDAGR
jgi:hypothetical protein